jgi:uncharacterized coiled-coil protein SlyX
VKGGKRLSDGTFEQNSINDKVQKRLTTLAEKLRDFGKTEEKAKKSENEAEAPKPKSPPRRKGSKRNPK